MIKDSGKRTEFSTGAVRDMHEGKGDCSLLPLAEVAYVISSPTLAYIEKFRRTGEKEDLYNALSSCGFFDDYYTMFLEVSIHFFEGSRKYSIDNWKLGIPLRSYVDSAVRHYLKHKRGDTDERHDRAFVWNILCAMWTFKNKPELDDFTEKKQLPAEKLIAERRCVETACYYNVDCTCTCTNDTCDNSLGMSCPDYMED